jgi:hypothetical protein
VGLRRSFARLTTVRSTLLFVLLMCFPRWAAGQTVIVGNGTIAPRWDHSLTGFEVTGDGTSLIAEFFGGSPTPGLRVGDVADLSTIINTTNYSNHPFPERVSGTMYPSVWVRAQLRIAAAPFTVPARPSAQTFTALSTAFTLKGEFAGYSDQAMTNKCSPSHFRASAWRNFIGPSSRTIPILRRGVAARCTD